MAWFRKSIKKTKHEYVEERLSVYIDGGLSPQERGTVEHHLSACLDCQWNLQTLQQTVQWTRELPTVAVPRSFAIPVPARPERVPGWRWSVPVLQGATALVAVLLLFVVAGDVWFTGSMPRMGAEPVALMEQSVVEEALPREAPMTLEEAPVVEEVTILEAPVGPEAERTVVEEGAPADAEKAMLEVAPSPASKEAPAAAAPPSGKAGNAVTPESGTMGAMGFEPTSSYGIGGGAEEETPLERTAPGMEEATVAAVVESTPAPLPTMTLASEAMSKQSGPASTVMAFAPEPETVDSEADARGSTPREPLSNWIGVAEIALAVIFVLLATASVVLMVWRGRLR